jgi:glutamate synthase domain-containing protein 2
LAAGVDFVTIDGRGGGTGAAPLVWRDTAGVPTLYAVVRARRFLDDQQSKVSLIVTGGLRTAADFAKCLALGADAVAVSTAVLTALAAAGSLSPSQKVANFLTAASDELRLFARAMGHRNIHDLSPADLVTTNGDIHQRTGVDLA